MVGKGVKQGSILSPSLFPLIMDPLLTRLQNSGLGLSFIDYVTGYVSIISMAYLFMLVDSSMLTTLEHCLLSSSTDESLEKQISIVEKFSRMKLNVQKCEIVGLAIYSLSLHQESVNKSSCKMPWLLVVSRHAFEPLS